MRVRNSLNMINWIKLNNRLGYYIYKNMGVDSLLLWKWTNLQPSKLKETDERFFEMKNKNKHFPFLSFFFTWPKVTNVILLYGTLPLPLKLLVSLPFLNIFQLFFFLPVPSSIRCWWVVVVVVAGTIFTYAHCINSERKFSSSEKRFLHDNHNTCSHIFSVKIISKQRILSWDFFFFFFFQNSLF